MLKKLTGMSMAAAASMILADGAFAGNMRCGTHLIEDSGRTGPGKYEVLKKCGQPTAKSGNTWVYDRGGSKRVIHFNDAGQVEHITDG